jgi:alanyl-tRNA synthetase
MEKELERYASDRLLSRTDEIIKKAGRIGDVSVIAEEIRGVAMDQLKILGDRIREKAEKTVALFATVQNEKLNLVCIVSDDLIKARGIKAGDLVREAASVAGGGGGGRPHLATAGAKDVSKMPAVLATFKQLVSDALQD